MDRIDNYHHEQQEVESTTTIMMNGVPPRRLQSSLWKSDELLPPLNSSSLSSSCSTSSSSSTSPVTTPRSHHKRINALHNSFIIATSSSSIINQPSSPPKYFTSDSIISSPKDSSSGIIDPTHRKDMLKKGTRIPLSLLASFERYENLERRRMSWSQQQSESKQTFIPLDQTTPTKRKTISMPSSPSLDRHHSVLNFNCFDEETHSNEYSISITKSESISSSPTVSTPPRPFAKSYSASFLDCGLQDESTRSIPNSHKKRPSAVKVETLSPNRTRLKPPLLESTNSSPNIFFKSNPSLFESNVKALKNKNLSPAKTTTMNHLNQQQEQQHPSEPSNYKSLFI